MSGIAGSEYFMTPAEHLVRARILVGHAEEALRTDPQLGYSAVGPAQTAQAHVAVAQEIDRQAGFLAPPAPIPAEVDRVGGVLDTTIHREAALIAQRFLPEYLGEWIAGVLNQYHTLPALVHHQNRIARDVLDLVNKLRDQP
jgi:hypothetical protein